MKLRKLLAAGVALTLGLSLGAPALAAEAADARLTRVTLAVKETLNIGDEYTEFYGEPNETHLGTRWNLSWTGEEETLTVTATDEGKVLSLYRREQGDIAVYKNGGTYAPAFPAMGREEAQGKAQAFLGRVLTQGEMAVFNDEGEESLSAQEYNFWGDIQLSGLATPMTFYVQVRLSDGVVTSFRREDVSDYAGTPGKAETSTTDDAARALLRDTLSLRLEYVRGEEGEPAVLRYLPNTTDDFYVDAATGKLVNLTELRALLREQYSTDGTANRYNTSLKAEAVAEDTGAGAQLSETELAGVAKLEGVLDKEALDKAVRSWGELGLKNYTLGSATYSVDRETDQVTARVSYARNTQEGIYRRNVTMDAKTGELLSMWGYDPYRENFKGSVDAKAAQSKAQAFLTKLWGAQFVKTELYNEPQAGQETAQWDFSYAQKVNGYFFPDNNMSVRISAADGTVMGFSKSFDDEVTFDSVEGIISEDAALDAWCNSFPVELAYLAIPVELNMTPEFEPLRNAGYHYYNALKAGYAFGERDVWTTGVDAKTGELVTGKTAPSQAMAYDDIAGHWAQGALEELARYRVGWQGGKAQPDNALTQLDFVALLASADGYIYDVETGDVDALYDFAVRRGILTREERDEDKALTRGEMVKMLLDSLGYGPVAGLKGIFRCDFADADAISAEQLGYAALAQGLGLATGDSQGNYAPNRPAVRCEGAVMLWKAMKG